MPDSAQALEELRLGQGHMSIYFVKDAQGRDKPEGFAAELADVIIRVLDTAGALGLDMERALSLKHEYNKTRPHRHGDKAI